MSAEVLNKEALQIHNETQKKSPAPSPSPAASGALGRLFGRGSVDKACEKRGDKVSETASMKSGTESQSTNAQSKGTGFRALMIMKKKMSKWRLGRSRAWSIGGSSMQGKEAKNRPLEPTYQLQPVDKTKFNTEQVSGVIADVVHFYFIKMEKYNAGKCAQMSRYIAEEVKGKVKELGYQRYKIMCQVLIGQKQEQGMHMASRSVWNLDTDNVASYVYYKNDIFVVGMVFGTYLE